MLKTEMKEILTKEFRDLDISLKNCLDFADFLSILDRKVTQVISVLTYQDRRLRF